MRKDAGQVFRLEDYRPSDYLIPQTRLTFRLARGATIVVAELTVERRPGTDAGAPLTLDGDGLKLKRLELDGVGNPTHEATPDKLVLTQLPESRSFRVLIETELDPDHNKALMGLYRSNGVYCTQCEPEGFRRITYFLDRPDILSVYQVRIEAPKPEAPLLLSNGNRVAGGDLENDWHFAEWHDPHPKPSYLFALVAGDLGCLRDSFTTMSGRKVELGIHVEHGKEKLAAYAMDALKRSMKWDEDVFGREYDLDVFNIVAVSDFNMGAMENKGLNIFNDKYVLADEATATDADFANIEAIIAHEYFHNWTGNRITCRDWFQLCLKEGLTVFRDHEFSADQRSRGVRRIAEVRTLRGLQFPEDQGPLAHPVRPRRYREINNFYTATVYEKGSEVVRMLRTILGAETFRASMDLYFERHDGQACTIEDFLKVFEDASGRDLSQFGLWYNQSGTPNLTVSPSYEAGILTLDIEQSVPPTPSESRKRAMHIPLAFALIGSSGEELDFSAAEGATVENGVIHVRKRSHKLRFHGVAERPVLSLNRGFSAPITVAMEQRPQDLIFLAGHDSDPFARWQAFNTLQTDALIAAYRLLLGGKEAKYQKDIAQLAGRIATDATLEPAYRALALTLPSETDIARDIGRDIDPDAIFSARSKLAAFIAAANREPFGKLYEELGSLEPFSPDAASAGRRALRNTVLGYLARIDGGADIAARHYNTATNMTDLIAGLGTLAHEHAASSQAGAALADFAARHASMPLALDKLYQIQSTAPGTQALETVRALMRHPAFHIDNPNRVRALLGAFSAGNQTGFHRADGAAYTFFADALLEIDSGNPQLSARLATAFRSWRSLEPVRQEKARQALVSIAAASSVSVDLRDIVERSLA
ncbi:aminopeptidase N [Aquamicrobium ahrensii]|uniref:Aminopeptidase N n=1 Tax=Aquamicrobium ahrensii TaxID=469551 RepID=A0ABV2KR17_9HYPH